MLNQETALLFINQRQLYRVTMARKTPAKIRVEPRFTSDEKITVSNKDRVNPASKVKKPGKPKKKTKKRPKKKPESGFFLWRWLNKIFKRLPRIFYWSTVLGLWGGIAVVGIFIYYGAKLPNASTWKIPERPPNIQIIAQDGTTIGNRGLTGGKAIRLEDMSPYIPQAVIAIEDRRFHAHFGFDPIGFARAMSRNIIALEMREGGSTLTQQLAKNLFLKPRRTFERKIQELILALWLETKYSKADILELYLNRVYFGAGATGVNAASLRYFGKPAKNVTIGEAALLAGLLKAPSHYSPVNNPELAQARARVVLRAMQREGYVKSGELNINSIQPGEQARNFRSGPAHFVANMVAKEARKILGNIQNDVIVETTINPKLMKAAHSTLARSLDRYGEKRRVSQAALVTLAPDGAIRALIGGRDYAKSQFNRAVDAKRQPGSAFKTFVWLNALERGYTPDTMLEDTPVRFGKWQPENYDQKYRGPVTLSRALAKSINTIAAKLTMEAGPKNIANTAARMGISSKLSTNASLALGTSEVSLIEMTSAYVPFANGGLYARPYLIKKITTNDGEILFERQRDVPIRVVERRELGMMNAMLRSVIDEGTGKSAKLKNYPAGGKTGTSQNFRDALFVGYTARLITGIWFGNDDNSPTKKLTGGSLPARAWKEFMDIAHKGLKIKELPGDPVALDPINVSAVPAAVPLPKYRPGYSSQKTASIKNQNRKRSILDIILNR